MKRHKLAKLALKHPELYSPAELQYFRMWLKQRKLRKKEMKRKFTKDEESYNSP